jgi:hypothetical protein
MAQKHFIQLKLGIKSYKAQVSTEGCSYVDEFKGAIKSKLPHLLAAYDAAQLTLFQPDGTTEIDPGYDIAHLNSFNIGPWTPLVVTVEELPIPAPSGSSKKQLKYKGMSTEASCRKFLDALAIEIYFEYDFPTSYMKPTMGDVLAAKDAKQGRPIQLVDDTGRPLLWWDYRTKDGIQFTTTPLPSRLSARQWNIMKSLNRYTNDRIHDAQLPKTGANKPFVVLPHIKFAKEYVDDLKSIAAIFRIVTDKDDLVVKDEINFSGSSSSESGSPDKDKKM